MERIVLKSQTIHVERQEICSKPEKKGDELIHSKLNEVILKIAAYFSLIHFYKSIVDFSPTSYTAYIP